MSLIAIIGDVHLANHRRFGGTTNEFGCNVRAQQVLDAIRDAMQFVVNLDKKTTFVFAGDFFDGLRPEPNLIDAAMRTIASARGNAAVHWLLGNHEYSAAASASHAIGVLRNQPNAYVHLEPEVQDKILFIPFEPKMTQQRLDEIVATTRDSYEVVVSHFGIIGGSTPPWLRDSSGAFHSDVLSEICEKQKIKLWASGDWHEYCKHTNIVYQTGALVPTGFDNPNFAYGRVIVYDTVRQSTSVYTIAGPRFVNITDIEQQEELVKKHPEAQPLYCRMTVDQSVLPETSAAVAGNNCIEVVADAAQQRETMKAAVAATKSVETLEQKLSAFINVMPVPSDVDRNDVFSLSKKYLGL